MSRIEWLISLLLLLGTTAYAQQKVWEGTTCRNRTVTLEAFKAEGKARAAAFPLSLLKF